MYDTYVTMLCVTRYVPSLMMIRSYFFNNKGTTGRDDELMSIIGVKSSFIALYIFFTKQAQLLQKTEGSSADECYDYYSPSRIHTHEYTQRELQTRHADVKYMSTKRQQIDYLAYSTIFIHILCSAAAIIAGESTGTCLLLSAAPTAGGMIYMTSLYNIDGAVLYSAGGMSSCTSKCAALHLPTR